MSVSEYPKVLVSEVGPRDGLQSIQAVMPTAGKLRWITALAAAGLHEIEVGSFVPAKLLPQMADVREVVAHALAIPGLHVAALAPNLRGAEGAFEAGVHKLTLPVSVTEAHSLANIRKTPAQMIDEVRAIVALRNERFPSVQIEAGVSVAFGCTIAGAVSDDETIAMAVAMAECGVDEIGLSDTSGYANPAQVRRLFLRLQREVGDKAGGAHFHNTRGQAANVVAALDAGVTTIDASRAASAAARMRRVRPATSSPRISCSCSRRWDSTRVSTSTRCSPRARSCTRRCRPRRCTAMCRTPGCRRASVTRTAALRARCNRKDV